MRLPPRTNSSTNTGIFLELYAISVAVLLALTFATVGYLIWRYLLAADSLLMIIGI